MCQLSIRKYWKRYRKKKKNNFLSVDYLFLVRVLLSKVYQGYGFESEIIKV